MNLKIQTDATDATKTLVSLRGRVTDKVQMFALCGVVMQGSIARTFREEGSPAGSWPRLAASTLRNRAYTTGHKLLIMSGRLFGSITYKVVGSILTIGTALVYAAVHQFGSRDYQGGVAGPRREEDLAQVPQHTRSVTKYARYKMVEVRDRHGNLRRVPRAMPYAKGEKTKIQAVVDAHSRRQNIPPRPYLVVRPEDPSRLTSACERFLAGKAAGLAGAA